MFTIETLLSACDAFRLAAGIERESTLSSRIFDDGKRLGRLREGREITIGGFNAAMTYLAAHWPADHPVPEALQPYRPSPTPSEDAA